MFRSYKMLAWAVRAGTCIAALVQVLTSNVTGTELKGKNTAVQSHLSFHFPLVVQMHCHVHVIPLQHSSFAHFAICFPPPSSTEKFSRLPWAETQLGTSTGEFAALQSITAGGETHRPGSTRRVWHHHHKLLTNDVKVTFQIRAVMIPSAQKRNTSIGL